MMNQPPERIVPKEMKQNNGLLIEHIARYKFASNYVQGKVYDIACGVGYGAEVMMAMGEEIKKIVGIDNNEDSIKYAQKHYNYPWTEFKVGEATNVNLVDRLGKADSIVSMETVEHIKDDYAFIANLGRMLTENGNLIISTPFGSGREAECSNPYHYRQYTEEEFRDLLQTTFSDIELYCQRNEEIEKPKSEKKYYLMVAVCRK